ncbi:MAG TPA: hypothetical protein ENI34_09100 [candidate division WOR-3 bacterium]|uniref:Uncharacterized protein n=1 Tax=candidate division WOR-3 bacterium TaxID=2052148 RepID=A0A9C9ENW2_UNCW3|nr:hypothetical protein [candidate division WOR-3 bacterium]
MFTKPKIIEGPSGTSRTPALNIIPLTAQPLSFRTKSFAFYVNRNNDGITLYIKTTDYHPGILAVPLERLEKLIDYLKEA